jgi:hypothetical protein
MLITSNAVYTGIRAEIHIINRCITPVADFMAVEKISRFIPDFQLVQGVPAPGFRGDGPGLSFSTDSPSLRDVIPSAHS